MIAQMNEGRYRDRSVLSRDAMAVLLAEPVPHTYGLGWESVRMGGRQLINNDGGNADFEASLFFDPQARVGVFIAADAMSALDALSTGGATSVYGPTVRSIAEKVLGVTLRQPLPEQGLGHVTLYVIYDLVLLALTSGLILWLVRNLHIIYWLYAVRHVTTSAIPPAAVADDAPRYPVLVFMSGRGGYRQSNTFQVENLVSHGYIVAGIDQPYASSGVALPRGRLVTMDPRMFDPARPGHPAFFDRAGVIPYLAQDVSFTLDQLAILNQMDPNSILTGRLDVQCEGVFAVSLGGIVAGEACRMDSRLKAFLVMDAAMPADVVQSGLQQPVMGISREAKWMEMEGWKQADIEETQATMRAVYDSLPGDGYLVMVPGMFHVNFSDAPYFSPLGSQIGFTGPINGQRGMDIINAYSLVFFDKELKGQPSPLLNGPSNQFSEVIFSSKSNQR